MTGAPFAAMSLCSTHRTTAAASGCSGLPGGAVRPQRRGGNPLAYARFPGAQGRRRRCGAVHQQARVVELERLTHGWRLRTPHGQVEARVVILCANGGNGTLHPSLARTVLPLAVTQVATEALPANLRAAILRRVGALTDLEADVFSIRYDTAGRLITAGRKVIPEP